MLAQCSYSCYSSDQRPSCPRRNPGPYAAFDCISEVGKNANAAINGPIIRTLTTPFDIVMEGETPGDDREQASSIVRPLAEAGVTWWLESVWGAPEDAGGVEGMRTRIRQGPPRL